MKKLIFLVVSILFITSFKSGASSILAGEITWSVVGKDSFLVKMILYRDCYGDNFDTVKLKVLCDSGGLLIKTLVMNLEDVKDLTPMCASLNPDKCSRCTDSLCTFQYGFEQYTFSKLLVFDSAVSCCSIKLVYESCCRSPNITNTALGSDFYTYSALNRCLSHPDNAPQFINSDLFMLPKNHEAILQLSGYDVDTDSIGWALDSTVFELASPLMNGTNIQYAPVFEYYKPLDFDGFPDTSLPFPQGFHMDTYNGVLKFVPIQTESTIFAVKVKQFRSGQQISEILRNFYLVIYQAPENMAPELTADDYSKEVFFDSTVSFLINTFDADTSDVLTIDWNPGFPYGIWVTDSGKPGVKHPTATVEWTPAKIYVSEFPYKFTVTVNDNACPLSASVIKEFEIMVKEVVSIDEQFNLNIRIYPVPLNENKELFICGNLTGSTHISIRDIQGRILVTKVIQTASTSIDLYKLCSGLYILEIQNGEKVYRQKLMVR
ncbi:T9SS type A sorting domain-containing protein [Bacteroidota bacterium]